MKKSLNQKIESESIITDYRLQNLNNVITDYRIDYLPSKEETQSGQNVHNVQNKIKEPGRENES